MKLRKNISLLLVIVLSLSLFIGCSKKEETNDKSTTSTNNAETEKGKDDKNPIATIEMEDGSQIKIELYPDVAPNTVRNFISLANSKFYDGLIFHRVIPDFMIQGGDPEGTGVGGPGYAIKGEFSSNGFENALKHDRGVISMARAQDKNSAGSQFFIMHKDSPHLDGEYAAFGKVIEGIEVVDKIAAVETIAQDRPKEDVKMKKVTVDTFGVEYKEVEKI
ncbi:cyclophilin type peptidyl-prolyl cis-trans isomerase/CLD family protein [Clostridium argentinense CDC 2741]|uniref:Peptidyl-prolyl cis-trans isomerase n=1 Tax=Clostridium argentinense CDC 2741 TaxID=1418104 RepID=A0A0C1ULH4_9CLOT|nr:peptidylprolyl isomerase [Clostridium argentinense]KIE48105.1 cyclophilin type peptidyl-prolyl cis-trans isomerase/CLD family protein [Clostridium argentinense CDC 2741]NFF40414.1 peptidylprolyl isomerase [Clostridium argentinense]NFP50489.1 peptidylprolyl isomerase [Clostridium argentinense]NFP72905.1 peptidylprolyl isomerase [Clostridium argentinense]NFP77583.1 peptidylprolyl isomerase [Clostridium argentinense]